MEKRELLFKQLKCIKDYWVKTSLDSLKSDADLIWSDCEEEYKILQNLINTEEKKLAYEKVLDEVLKGAMHSILVMIDGGDDLSDKLTLDLIVEQTKESLKKGVALHEEFYRYLLDIEG